MASKKIQGITIELDADVQPIENALGKLNKDISSVEKDLKDVNDALKLNPGDVDQAARKLELLAEKAELSEKKVDALKQAQEHMDAQGVDKSSRAYQDLGTQLSKAESQLKSVATEMERTSKSSNEVAEGQKLLSTYFAATGRDADSLVTLVGTKLVDAYKSGQLGAAGFQRVLEAISKEITGSKTNVDSLKNALSTIDDGGSLAQVRTELEQISKANVSGLGLEFESLNQKSRALDAELKQINNSLKLDPSSLDLCAQKEQVLSQAIGESEQKLVLLNQRFAELKATNVDLNDEEFRTLQREITNTETALNGYKANLVDLQTAQQRLDTYFNATGTSARDFSNILGSELVAKIERGEASSQELANALDKIGASATSNKGDIERFKSALDSIDSGVSLANIKSEIDSLGAEAKETETDVGGLKEQLSSIADSVQGSGLMEAADGISELSGYMQEFASASLEAAGTVQQSQSQIQMSLGVTKEEAAEVAEHAHSVWSQNFGETQEEVTEVMVNIRKQIQDVNDTNLEDVTKKFLTLQSAGMDNEEAMRAVNAAMQAFSTDSSTALDMITYGFQNINDPMHELGDVVAEYSPLFAQAGYSGSEMLSALAAGGDSGARSLDLVADLIKEMGIRLSDGSIATAVTDLDAQFSGMGVNFQGVMDDMTAAGASPKEIFQALVAEIQKLPDEQAKATAASALFGSQGEDAGVKVLTAVANAGDAYGNFGGAADEAAAANENAVGSMQRKWEDFMTAFAPVGEKLADIAIKIMDALKPAIDWLADALANMDPTIMTFIAAFVGIVGAIGPVIAAIGGLIAVLGGPVTAAIAGVIALVSAIIAIFTNWGSISSWLSEQWGGFCAEVGQEWDKFCTDVSNAWNGMWNGITEFFAGAGASVQEMWTNFCNFISSSWSSLWSGAQALWATVSQWFSSIFSEVQAVAGNLWAQFCQNITTGWQNIWTTVQSGWQVVTEWFASIFGGLGESIGGLWNNFCALISSSWDNTINGLKSIWDSVSGAISGAWDSFCSGVQSTWDSFTGTISKVWNDCWNGIKDFATNLWDTIKNAFNDFVELEKQGMQIWMDWIKQIWENTWNTVKSIWDSVSSAIQNAWNSFCSTVSNAWNGFVNGVKNVWEQGWNYMHNLIDNIIRKVIEIIANLVNSGREKFDSFKNFISDVWNNIKSTAEQVWSNIVNTVKNFVTNVYNAIVGTFENIKKKVQEIWNNITGTVGNVMSSIGGFLGISYNVQNNPVKIPLPQVAGNVRTIEGPLIKVKDLAESTAEAAGGIRTIASDDLGSTAFSDVTAWLSSTGASIQEYWGTLCQTLLDKWNAIWTTIQETWESTVVTWFTDSFTALNESAGALWTSFCDGLKSTWEGLFTSLQEMWTAFTESFSESLSGFSETVQESFTTATDSVGQAWQNALDGLLGKWQESADNLTSAVSEFCDNLLNSVSEFADSLTSKWSEAFDTLTSQAREATGSITSSVEEFCNSIVQSLTECAKNLTSTWADCWAQIQNGANGAKEQVVAAINAIVSEGGNALKNFAGSVQQAWSAIASSTSKAWSAVVNAVAASVNRLKDLFEQLVQASQQASENMQSGPRTMADLLRNRQANISTNFLLPEWHAKGGILTKPTLFTHGNTLHGAGEAGAEAIAPIDELYANIDKSVDNRISRLEDALLTTLEAIRQDNQTYHNKDLSRDTNIVMDTGALVGQIARPMDEKLGRNRILSGRR